LAEAFSLESTKQMKWHPAMIRWALYLHHKCYKTLRNSGVIHLPSEHTLYNYRHFVPSEAGFSTSAESVKQKNYQHMSQ